ncbi:MAG: glycosyltransferase [Candidatus Saccharicenans sp.]
MSKQNIKCCHITTVHPPFDVRIFHKECKTLAKAGYEVFLIAQHDKEETVDGVHIIPLPKARNRVYRILFLPIKALNIALRLEADVYHIHDPELIPLNVFLRLLGKKIIFDVHEYYSEIILAKNKFLSKLLFVKFILKFFLENIPIFLFNFLIFPTESLRKEYGSPSNSITLVNFPTIQEDNNVELNIEAKSFDVIFVGSVSSYRLKFMLEVAYQLSLMKDSFKWLFLGISPANIDWVLKNYDREFIEHHIVMVGRVPYEAVINYLKRSRIGFNYHPYEKRFLVAIPMKVFEYMMMGLPVVTTALLELTRYLNNYVHAILVDSQDPLEYSNAILKLLENPDEAFKIGNTGKDLIFSKLNWDYSETNKLILIYKRLLENKKWEKN